VRRRSAVGRLTLSFALIAGLLLASFQTVAAAEPLTPVEAVIATAKAQLGDQWKYQATGPDRFDCSGLVFYSFKMHGLKDLIGGYRSAHGYYKYFNNRGRADMEAPKVGDLIVWGKFQHVGIYLGDGMAISTLTTKSGVSIHPVKGYLGIKVRAYLHVDWSAATSA
jgi:cell wall-associated NlpC family hydrolase